MIRNLFAVAVVLVLSGAVAAEVASSDTCGSCHRDIYRMWRDSAHAEASEDPFFSEVLREIRRDRGAEMTRLCLDCHAPIAVLAEDLAMSRSTSREGVACEYCHGLKEVEVTPRGARAVLEIGEIKRGTIAEADSPAHKVAFSELHRTSRVCAPCHEYVSPDGAAVLTTYSEWTASSAAGRGETCQSCHMSITAGAVVDPRIQRDSVARVNLHEMPGGHSLKQLLKALNVKILPERDGKELKIEVTVRNEGAGHAVPTGMPGRRIVMVVEVTTGDQTHRDERVYAKTFSDGDGRTLDHVADLFSGRAKLLSDTRIRADETRVERFSFPASPEHGASVAVKLHYEHAPRGPEEERVWVTFYSERRFVRRADGN